MGIEFKRFQFERVMWRFIFLLLIGSSLLVSDRSIPSAVAAEPEAHIKGAFGTLHSWPIIPIAMMLMPDGRVFVYGTDPLGKQGATLYYAIWNPLVGIGSDAFELLPNTTGTNIFCAAHAFIPSTGHALIVGGDALVNGKSNYANSDVNIFDPSTDTLARQSQSMALKRWYATMVTLTNGEHVVLGGRDSRSFAGTTTIPPTVNTYSTTPEVRSADGNWRLLDLATSDTAYGSAGGASWNYPRAWLDPQGSVFIVAHNGSMYKLDTSGSGNLLKYTTSTSASEARLPSVMFAPGRILSVRKNRVAVVIDINGTKPVVTAAGSLVTDRKHGTATVLANGQVWINGGSATGNDLAGAVLDSELWDPQTNTWVTTANAATYRLYHSASLLLADGSVLTGGGGSPGPLTQLNGEIFYPPYLFKKDGSGEFANRPVIIDAPTTMIGWNQEFSIEATENISRVTLVRVGAVTHNFNQETRFFEFPIAKAGNIVTLLSPSSTVAPPGFYLLFAWNTEGVPSVAKIIHIGEL